MKKEKNFIDAEGHPMVEAIIDHFYADDDPAKEILLKHSRQVRDFAVKIAQSHPEWSCDIEFISEAAMLHDLGINACDAPKIGCYGKDPYIRHGFIGAERLRKLGLPRHALVCERHTGTGITLQMIREHKWDLPKREMVPLSLEEQIICFADKFYSKSGAMTQKPLLKVKKGLLKYSEDDLIKFDAWCQIFLTNISLDQEPTLD